MVQIIDAPQSFGSQMGRGLGNTLGSLLKGGVEGYVGKKQREGENKFFKEKFGIDLKGASPEVREEITKEFSKAMAKEQLLKSFGLNPQQQSSGTGQQLMQGEEQPSQQGQPQQGQPQQGQPQQGQPQQGQRQQNFLENMTPEQRIIAESIIPGVGKMAQEEEKIRQKERFHNEERMDKKTAPALEEARVKRQAMPSRKMSLSLFRNAINEGNVSYFSKSNLAGVLDNLTGHKFNLKSDASGAQLAFAGKNYLIETLDKVGAKGLNQYLEKQVSTAQPQIGASPQANNSVLIPMETTVAIEDFYLNRLGQYEDMYDKLGKPLPYSAVRNAQKEAAQFADDQLKKMSYELRENQESTMSDSQIMDFGTKDNPKSVTPGTPLTERAATLFLKKYGFDEEDPESEKSLKSIKTALKVAKQLGYDVEVTE